MQLKSVKPSRERGSALVEFVLCFSLFWVPLFFGTLVIGFSLIRAMQVTQVCRDAAHMAAFGTDFSQTSAKTLLAGLAPGLGITAQGRGVVVLSTITYVDAAACSAGGHSSTATCPNYQKAVFTRQFKVGNTSLPYASTFGNAQAVADSATGFISATSYTTDPNAIATGFLNVIPFSSSTQVGYIAETFVRCDDFNWWNSLSNVTVSARSIF